MAKGNRTIGYAQNLTHLLILLALLFCIPWIPDEASSVLALIAFVLHIAPMSDDAAPAALKKERRRAWKQAG